MEGWFSMGSLEVSNKNITLLCLHEDRSEWLCACLVQKWERGYCSHGYRERENWIRGNDWCVWRWLPGRKNNSKNKLDTSKAEERFTANKAEAGGHRAARSWGHVNGVWRQICSGIKAKGKISTLNTEKTTVHYLWTLAHSCTALFILLFFMFFIFLSSSSCFFIVLIFLVHVCYAPNTKTNPCMWEHILQ